MNPALVLAFGAGAASAFSPCGIAMLPATVALLLRGQDGSARLGERAWRGGVAGILLALGFSIVVAAAATLFSLVAQTVLRVLPLLMVALAVALVAMGVLLYRDRWAIGLSTGALARRMDAIGGSFVGTLVAAGAAYGLAALSCTLPIFIALLAEVAGAGLAGTVSVVVVFATGVALVLVAVSVGTALWRGAMERTIHGVLPYVGRASGVIVVFAGLWIAYYWVLGPGHWLA